MDLKNQRKLLDAGFVIIRKSQFSSDIENLDKTTLKWRVLGRFTNDHFRDGIFFEMLESPRVIEL